MIIAMLRFGCKSNVCFKGMVIFGLVTVALAKLIIMACMIRVWITAPVIKEYTFGELFWLDVMVIIISTISIIVHCAK